MKSTLIVIALIAITVRYGDALEAKCKGVDIKVSEEQMMSIKECAKEVGVTSVKDFNPGNAGCFSKCIMQKKNLIDADGKPHKENIMKAVDEGLPDSLKDAWKGEMEKCLDNEGSKIMSPDDEKCSSYLPLTMCVHAAFLNICK